MSKKGFNFHIEADVFVSIDEIWPDGDAPENPTVDDVKKVIKDCGGDHIVLEDWNLLQELDLEVSSSIDNSI